MTTEPLAAAVDALTRLSRILEHAAAPLSLADYRALSAIAAGEVRASRLARRLAVGKPAISATVDSLVRRNLLTRERATEDQRAFALTLTESGRAAFERVRGELADRVAQVAAATDDPTASIAALAGLDEAIEQLRSAVTAR